MARKKKSKQTFLHPKDHNDLGAYDPALYSNEQFKLASEILAGDDGTLAPAVVRICEKLMADAHQEMKHKQESAEPNDRKVESAAASEARNITAFVRDQYPSAKLTQEQLLDHLRKVKKLQDDKAQAKSAKGSGRTAG